MKSRSRDGLAAKGLLYTQDLLKLNLKVLNKN